MQKVIIKVTSFSCLSLFESRTVVLHFPKRTSLLTVRRREHATTNQIRGSGILNPNSRKPGFGATLPVGFVIWFIICKLARPMKWPDELMHNLRCLGSRD